MLRKDENLQKTLAEPSKLKHTIVDEGNNQGFHIATKDST